ncbi:MAG: hypothetical protein WCG85_21080, partial [Polyangia bacterium]
DGRRAFSGSNDRTLRMWDLDTGVCLRVLESHADDVYSVAVCADGRRALSGSQDHTLRLWDLDTGECLGTWLWGGSFNYEMALGEPVANARTRIVAGDQDGSVRTFELMPPGPLTRTTLATWSPTHPLIASVVDTGAITLHRWHDSAAQLQELARSASSSEPISSLRFSVDGTRLCVSASGAPDRVLDAATLQPIPRGSNSIWTRMRALITPSKTPAPPPNCNWASARDTSPNGTWRAVIRDGRLVVDAIVSIETGRDPAARKGGT